MYGPYKIMNTKGTYANWYGYLDGNVVAGPYATRTVVVEEILHLEYENRSSICSSSSFCALLRQLVLLLHLLKQVLPTPA